MNNGAQCFGYFACGVAVGVAAGLLFAPKSGAETRESIASGIQSGQDYLKDKSNKVLATINQGQEYVKNQSNKVLETINRSKEAIAQSTACFASTLKGEERASSVV